MPERNLSDLKTFQKHHVALPSHSRPYSRESGSSRSADSPSFAAKDVEPLRRKVTHLSMRKLGPCVDTFFFLNQVVSARLS